MSESNIDRFYENLKHYVRMVCERHTDLLVIDAKGGLGKTHNVKAVLEQEKTPDMWTHQRGFTTPVELYKTLYMAQPRGHVLFMDDVSGLTSSTKAIDMLKAATDTEGAENWVQYNTSQSIEHPTKHDEVLPPKFCFRGTIIMSFNKTPNNHHFDALVDRGIKYELAFDFDERCNLIEEAAKLPSFYEGITVPEQKQVADWLLDAVDPSIEPSLRTLDEACSMYSYAKNRDDTDWRDMAVESLGRSWKKLRIKQLRQNRHMNIEEQVQAWCEETGLSERRYYQLLESMDLEAIQKN